ncbi:MULTISPECIES: thermonuclease family protein [Bradyrhizobium]|uniref:Bll0575 protein n=1 Tax=Bradyrhizobium diazoefficiens (strain JCM 10833 / BCRC 13528 / IAM 13628 / NBRC 14792 / USDA 110) TaxID=224911 RepID=Q89WV3_BRADU|nr:thermonuclease family protein [Bradyrhizobium diazoefficiens]MBP1060731.1 endonuclease YncB(thermonuclease family) [Bradyrhizobium japonicum]AND93635.1 nuclease [Bradyrhizobium diazoefficiens USDA 110]AWO87724.1 nuclease [Bradyrhizobium diazoefficiens]PDT62553.1 nuclease [Bradyrhizobium diazoefficiens]QBP19534.1 nuclease [Bradyrhizobium diazoefficiens]
MRFHDRPNAYRPQFGGSPFGRRFAGLLPWMFVVGVAAAIVLTFRHGVPVPHGADGRSQDTEIILQQSGNSASRQPVDVIRTIDGDTFLARVHQQGGRDLVVRVRLRGIDAPEMKASCQEELDKAEAATDALRNLLGQGGVTITNLGPDKYGRVLADVATKRAANVSAVLLAGGYARSYNGGHRDGWCARGWRFW